jgi:hypothetical protein
MAAPLPRLDAHSATSSATTDGERLTVSTGTVTRIWHWTGTGLGTISLARNGGRTWGEGTPDTCDWELPGGLPMTGARLVRLEAQPDDDEGFTSSHLRVAADIEYPQAKLAVRYSVWAYPGSTGFRTQLLVKALPGYQPPARQKPTASIDRSGWKVVDATRGENAPSLLFDGNPKTCWKVAHPDGAAGETVLVLDLGDTHSVTGFGIRQEQDYRRVWAVDRVLVSYSTDGQTWSEEETARFSRATYPQTHAHAAHAARFVRFRIAATALPYTDSYGTALSELLLFDEAHPVPVPPSFRNERVPVPMADATIGTVAYFSETQFRNADGLDLVLEESRPIEPSVFADANLAWVETAGEGLCLLKESHKTANHHGHLTGDFRFGESQLACTGWGIGPNEIGEDWERAWATWTILYQGGPDQRQKAVKTFDAVRYPVRPELDGVVMANTWGGGTSSQESRQLAWEKRVLPELEAVAELGIDMYQIDDGWQVKNLNSSHPDGNRGWKPHPDIYPNDWQPVRARAEQLGIRLGLWTPVQSISLGDLCWNQERGHFLNWKMDFANLPNYRSRQQLEDKVREFIRRFDHTVNVSWDLTEISPRYGYFWAREYGSVWLENRKKRMRPWILYTPHLTLRDAWQLSSYANIHKFQLPIVNVAEVDPPSDAKEHPQSYASAIAMAGIPMFFEQPSTFTGEAKQQVINTIRLFKSCRQDMLSQLVYPIGPTPNNASFTGFQTYQTDRKHGYLLLFRELHAAAAEGSLNLRFLGNRALTVQDLRSGKETSVGLGPNGSFRWRIDRPADFALLRYSW